MTTARGPTPSRKDLLDEAHWEERLTIVDDETCSLLGVPLGPTDRPLGVLVVRASRPHAFGARDVYAVAVAGAQVVAAIERSFAGGGQSQADRARLLLEAAETINSSLDSTALETTILAEAARLAGARKAALLVVHGDVLVAQTTLGLSERCRRLFVAPLEGSVFGRAILNDEMAAVDDVGAAGTDAEPLCAGEYRAMLAAPLRSQRATYGVLALFYEQPRHFAEHEKTTVADLRDPGRHRARQPATHAGEGPDGGA